ncbi:hypothetical protein Pelo_12104 [Pelomyxa schiedti]|nr:hypothetical protein Pelo_12104 [Pelomyxa schiedti]
MKGTWRVKGTSRGVQAGCFWQANPQITPPALFSSTVGFGFGFLKELREECGRAAFGRQIPRSRPQHSLFSTEQNFERSAGGLLLAGKSPDNAPSTLLLNSWIWIWISEGTSRGVRAGCFWQANPQITPPALTLLNRTVGVGVGFDLKELREECRRAAFGRQIPRSRRNIWIS